MLSTTTYKGVIRQPKYSNVHVRHVQFTSTSSCRFIYAASADEGRLTKVRKWSLFTCASFFWSGGWMLKADMADPIFPFTPFLTPNFKEIRIQMWTRRTKAFFFKIGSVINIQIWTLATKPLVITIGCVISKYEHVQPKPWFSKLHLQNPLSVT